MQIHELNKKKKISEGVFDALVDPVKAAAQTVKTGYQQGGIKGAAKAAASPTAYAQAKQSVTQANAAKAYQGLQKQGYSSTPTQVSFDQSLSKVQSNPQVQQYIQGLAQQWEKSKPTQAKDIGAASTLKPGGKVNPRLSKTPGLKPAQPVAPAPATPVAPATPTPPPVDTSTIRPATKSGAPTPAEQAKLQQKIQAAMAKKPEVNEAFTDLPGGKTSVTPASMLGTQFRQWASSALKTPIDTLEKNPEVAPKLKAALDNVIKTNGSQQAVIDYLSTAVAGIQMARANKQSADTTGQPTLSSAPGATDIRQQLQSVGISNQQLLKLGQLAQATNNGPTSSTGNPAVDNILRAMGIRV